MCEGKAGCPVCYCHVWLLFSDNTMPSLPLPATKVTTLAPCYSIIHCSHFFPLYFCLPFFFHTFLSLLLAVHSFFLPRSVFVFRVSFTHTAACKPLHTPNTLHKLFVAPYQQMLSFPNGHFDDDGYRRRNPGRVFWPFICHIRQQESLLW